ncbi:MAG TPA: ABC-F family ATP-binding cassette domain-containing protein, partial [Tepidisphaeraceae bacterium]
MPIATLANIEKTFGQRVLFEKLNFIIDRGERVGLIGENGSGKTTLFKVFTGEVTPDVGDVSVAKSIKVGYLAQDATFDAGNTVMDEAELAFAELHDLSHKLREIEHAMAEQSGEQLDKTLRQYENVQHEFELAGGYAWRHRLEATLDGVGLDRGSWEQNVETLSGGQRSRLALAKLLISEPDLLLLDEPTNHLDLSAIEWLEQYLLEFKGAVLLISHDRYLLDRLATRIVWLTRRQLSSYPGNYSAFVQQRQIQELSQQRAYEEQQEDIAKQAEFIRRFGAGQRSKEAKGREKRLNRLLKSDAMIEQVQASKQIHVKLHTDQRAGDRVLRVRELSKSFPGKRLWEKVKFEVGRGERIGIIGPNGSGKTTLLRVLMG